MATVNKSVTVPYSAEEMFALVNQVDDYQDFLPWCRTSTVVERDADVVKASLQVGVDGMHKSFTTANTLFPHERIEMQLVSGPFKYLQGTWRFLAKAEQECEISLNLEFQFSNRMLEMAFGRMFHKAISSMVEAFNNRAIDLYGERVTTS